MNATDIFSTAGDVIEAVVLDPALPEVLTLAEQLKVFEQSSEGANPGGPGIGLSEAVPFLRAYLFYRQHPGYSALIGLGVLAVPVLLGIVIGRSVER